MFINFPALSLLMVLKGLDIWIDTALADDHPTFPKHRTCQICDLLVI